MLANAPIETQKMFINCFSSSSVALQKLKYDPSDQYSIGDLLDNYHEELSSLMRKLIQY